MPVQRSTLRVLLTLGGLVFIVAVAVRWSLRLERPGGSQFARWFTPGPLGSEPGRAQTPPGPAAFLTRHVGGLDSPLAAEWGRRNALTPALSFSHNLAGVFPPDLFGQHPDYFPLVNGQRKKPSPHSQSWNPDLARIDVAQHAAATARAAFTVEPGRESFALGVNDGLNFGESAETLAAVLPQRWFRGRPDYSNLVFRFMNRAAEDLSRTHPDKYLGALAYYWAENSPDFPVHPQVVPFLTADRSQGYDPAFWREEFALQERWAKSGVRRIGLYDYLDGFGFLIPRIHPHFLAENLRHARAIGFTDYYGEASPNWGIDGPTSWLVAQLLQDPTQNADLLLNEYYTRYFQEAAAPMRRFFERCEEQWVRQPGASYWMKHFRNESQADVFPSAVCVQLSGLLERAGQLAVQEKVKARVAFVAEAFGVTERFVRLNEARARLSRELVTGALAGRAGADLLAAYLDARRDFVRYSKELTAREPLAFYRMGYDDFLRNNPTFAAAAILTDGNGAESGNSTGRAGAPAVLARLHARSENWVAEGQAFARAVARGETRELLKDGTLEGPLAPGLKIAGLTYGVALPGAWQSQIEPTQTHVGEVTKAAARHGEAGLRISGAINTTVFQWLPAAAGRLYVASVRTRGQVTSSNAVFLTFGWLDAQGRHLGSSLAARLPDGTWPDWVQLQQGARAPQGAAWVGLGVHLQNQVPGDWAEFDDFSLLDAGVEK